MYECFHCGEKAVGLVEKQLHGCRFRRRIGEVTSKND